MFEQHFLSPDTADPEVFGPLQGGERVMWRGRCGVAEYAFDQAASMPRWTLPESTDVLVTDRRVIYAHTPKDGDRVRSGELRWLWPQHIRVQPGARSDNRGAAATQIQLVCGGADGTFPALVFAGGDLATVGDADRVANTVRQAIARFRIDNATQLDLDPNQTRMLSRALIGPEFRNHQGGEGQTVSVIGALLVNRPSAFAITTPATRFAKPAASSPAASSPSPAPAAPASSPAAASSPAPAASSAAPAVASASAAAGSSAASSAASSPASAAGSTSTPRSSDDAGQPSFLDRAEGTRLISYRPGRAADAARAIMAARAEQEAQQAEPEIASRAADLAARVANMVTASVPEEDPTGSPAEKPVDKHAADEDTGESAVVIEFPLRFTKRPEPRIPEPRHSEPRQTEPRPTGPGHAEPRQTDAGHADPRQTEPGHVDPRTTDRVHADPRLGDDVPTTNLAARAQSLRRTAARMAANSGRGRIGTRRPSDREPGITSRSNRDR
jgi:hypothetical protein